MSMVVFGPGSLYVTRTDLPNQTPINIGFVNEFSYDEAGETKQLFGQNQYPLAAARGTIKASGKMKAAKVSGLALNAVFNGASFTAGQLLMAQAEVHPAAATVSVTNSSNFDTDLGVIYASTGLPLLKVSSAPAAGQYSTSAGTYTFSSGDVGSNIAITYAYKTATAGQTKTVTNQAIGTSPTFQIDYTSTFNAQPYYVRIFQSISSKLSNQFKLTDFYMPEIDFEFFANAAGQVYEVSYADIG
jgi:hypothetical protein